MKTNYQLDNHINNFFNYLQNDKNRSKRTVVEYKKYLSSFTAWLAKEHPNFKIEELDINIFNNFKAHVLSKNISKGTQNHYFYALRSFLRYLLSINIHTLEPSQIVLPKVEIKPKKYLTLLERNKYVSVIDISTTIGLRDRAMAELFLSQGLSVSELACLNRNDITYPNIFIHGKRGKNRTVRLNENARIWIERYLAKRTDQEVALFISLRKSERLVIASIERIIIDYGKKAGFSFRITPMILRNTFAATMFNNGANIKDVQELLGHASLATTDSYIQLSNSAMDANDRKSNGQLPDLNIKKGDISNSNLTLEDIYKAIEKIQEKNPALDIKFEVKLKNKQSLT